MLLFGLLSVTIWIYFLVFYIKINANARDWYLFTWLTVIAFLLDEVYFLFRYYNLYLDLKENDEIISEQEIDDMGADRHMSVITSYAKTTYTSIPTQLKIIPHTKR